MGTKKKVLIGVLVVLVLVAAVFGWYLYRMWPMLSSTMGDVELTEGHQSHQVSDDDAGGEQVSTVYMSTEITPEGLMNAYRALGKELTGDNIAVKLSTGEPGSNYLDADLIADLVHEVNGTIVECNTAYQGSRTETQMHYQVAADHGYTDIADFVIMDEDGSASIPVEGGTRMTENLVGAHFPEYDGFLVLSHFKGHAIAGFGGAIKNISIGMASQEGKCLIHTDGASHTSPWGGAQDPFLECMAEAGKSVQDAVDGNMLYINVMTGCPWTVTAIPARPNRICTISASWLPPIRWRWIRPVWIWCIRRRTALPWWSGWNPETRSMSWPTGKKWVWETEATSWYPSINQTSDAWMCGKEGPCGNHSKRSSLCGLLFHGTAAADFPVLGAGNGDRLPDLRVREKCHPQPVRRTAR